jgi:hypothetical protein
LPQYRAMQPNLCSWNAVVVIESSCTWLPARTKSRRSPATFCICLLLFADAIAAREPGRRVVVYLHPDLSQGKVRWATTKSVCICPKYKTSFIIDGTTTRKGKQPAKNTSTELRSHHKENNFGIFFVRSRQRWTTKCLISVGVAPDEMCTLVSAELHTMGESRSWGLVVIHEINDKSYAVGNIPSDVLHSKNCMQCLRILNYQFDGTIHTDSFSLQALT